MERITKVRNSAINIYKESIEVFELFTKAYYKQPEAAGDSPYRGDGSGVEIDLIPKMKLLIQKMEKIKSIMTSSFQPLSAIFDMDIDLDYCSEYEWQSSWCIPDAVENDDIIKIMTQYAAPSAEKYINSLYAKTGNIALQGEIVRSLFLSIVGDIETSEIIFSDARKYNYLNFKEQNEKNRIVKLLFKEIVVNIRKMYSGLITLLGSQRIMLSLYAVLGHDKLCSSSSGPSSLF